MYQPREGKIGTLPSTLEVLLLPKGSPAFLEPAQIETMLDRLSGMTLQIQQLKGALKQAETENPPFDLALQGWAADHGLPYAEVNNRVRAWSEDVLAHRNEASLVKQAEAELGLRHYEQAGLLFQSAANISKAALHRKQENLPSGLRRDLRNEVQLDIKSATALQSGRLSKPRLRFLRRPNTKPKLNTIKIRRMPRFGRYG